MIRVSVLTLVALTVSAAPAVDYSRQVQPLLRARCYGCHGSQQQMSGLRLDDKTSALRVLSPGAPASSLLLQRVSGSNGMKRMPPVGAPLTEQEIATLRTWIEQGATWSASPAPQTLWSFQPIRRPQVPSTGPTPIDSFVLAKLQHEGIAPSPQASQTKLLRRLSLDLTGLPPTPRELDEFLADSRSDAYQRQVDRLLASPHYGEKWARHWLDLARYADSDGYEKDWFRPWAWRYREWVIDALNHDLPFDQFTTDQIAGDLLPQPSIDQRVATGFERNTLTNREGGVDNNQFRFENTVDRASTVGTVWLGLTVGCAQCHNHKFDPISQKDFYQFFAFFDNTEEVDVDAPKPGEMEPYRKSQAEYRHKRQELLDQYKVPELQAAWEQRLHQTIANPGKWLDWDLAWDCVLKLTEGGDGGTILQKPATGRSVREQDVLTDHFIRNYHFAVGPKVYKDVKFKELDDKLTALKNAYPQLSQAMAVEERSDPQPSHLRVRGDYKNPGVEVSPNVPAVLPPLHTPGRATRLDLARWLVSRDNPLTARVTVNRVWQELFGQGIVRTSDDFGTRGESPSHPELLDWLAAEFMDRGWSYKSIIRTIVLSSTYRQSSKTRPELEEKDPSNALLARQSRLRLPAELIRDSALSVSGLIDLEVGGKSVRPLQPAGVTELGYGKKAGSGWDESKGAERYRRGLYIQFQRSTPFPQLVNFDAPKSNVPVCRRERSNTSLQALNLLNDPAFIEAAQALAARTLTSGGTQFPQRLQYAFRLALGREANEVESRTLHSYWERQNAAFQKDPASAKALLASPPNGLDTIQLASWTGLSSILLNLDEFITRE